MSQGAGEGVQRQTQTLAVTAPSTGRLDVDYGCNDVRVQSLASCIAPPHHRVLRTSNGLTIDGSALYRTPLVFERVSAAR